MGKKNRKILPELGKKKRRIVPAQWALMVDFMERHGDISQFNDICTREYNNIKWCELTKLLNKKENGASKSVTKWRKTWTDMKTITKKKEFRVKTGLYKKATISDLEKRILKIIETRDLKNAADKSGTPNETDNLMDYKEMKPLSESVPDIQGDHDTRKSEKHGEDAIVSSNSTHSPAKQTHRRLRSHSLRNNDSHANIENKKAKRANTKQKQKKGTSKSKTTELPSGDPEPQRRNSTSSHASSSNSQYVPGNPLGDSFNSLIEEYLKLDNEKEKNLHKREMARIKQNQEVISIVGRFVNVLEMLTPSVQKYIANATEKR